EGIVRKRQRHAVALHEKGICPAHEHQLVAAQVDADTLGHVGENPTAAAADIAHQDAFRNESSNDVEARPLPIALEPYPAVVCAPIVVGKLDGIPDAPNLPEQTQIVLAEFDDARLRDTGAAGLIMEG